MNSLTTKAIPAPLVATRPALQHGLWRRRLLIGIVMAYAGLLIIAPLVSLTTGAFREGVGAVITALSQPDVLASFWRTATTSPPFSSATATTTW